MASTVLQSAAEKVLDTDLNKKDRQLRLSSYPLSCLFRGFIRKII